MQPYPLILRRLFRWKGSKLHFDWPVGFVAGGGTAAAAGAVCGEGAGGVTGADTGAAAVAGAGAGDAVWAGAGAGAGVGGSNAAGSGVSGAGASFSCPPSPVPPNRSCWSRKLHAARIGGPQAHRAGRRLDHGHLARANVYVGAVVTMSDQRPGPHHGQKRTAENRCRQRQTARGRVHPTRTGDAVSWRADGGMLGHVQRISSTGVDAQNLETGANHHGCGGNQCQPRTRLSDLVGLQELQGRIVLATVPQHMKVAR